MYNFKQVNIIVSSAIFLSIFCTLVTSSNPYCEINETSVTYKPIQKTRIVIKKPTGMFKFLKKTKTHTEVYTEQEEHVKWKMTTVCCEGYNMSELNICEPICVKGCPQQATCVEPNRCQCRRGYIAAISSKDGSHYCKPICEQGCPEFGRCAAPNMCECERGYRAEQQLCVPHCSSKCPNGMCVHPELCECDTGYRASEGTCVVGTDADETTTETAESTENINDIELSETGSETELDLDDNEKIFLSTPEPEPESNSTDSDIGCPEGFQRYNGICRASLFASNEIDCRFKPCVQNADCLDNGTCVCPDGFLWHKPTVRSSGESTFQPDDVNILCLSLQELSSLEFANVQIEEDVDDTDWLSVTLIILGLACLISVAVFLAVKFFRRETGELDVEAKTDLYCAYDNNSCHEIPKVY